MTNTDKNKPRTLSENLFPVVGIGASAGGLEAFKKLIKAITEDSGMAYILVQHLHPGHESALPEILQRVSKIPVQEISDNVKVQPNHIYVIPSNKMLVATDGVLKLSERAIAGKLNLPIDLFFSSLAEVHQSHGIGVVLSGTGADGTAGLKDIKDHGGITFAQDPGTAGYDGMPQSAIDADIVDFIIAPELIPSKLMELQQSFSVAASGEGDTEKNKSTEDNFRQILALLRVKVGVDFSFYKQTTVRRRIVRRMFMLQMQTNKDYLEYLRKNKTELDILFQDLLIPVTSFFRDPTSFDSLCETVLPEIVKTKTLVNPLRIWVAGCSTGQEAYSLAICCSEYLASQSSNIKVQIFATDLSENAIKKARTGIFTKKEMEGISEPRMQQFFDKTNGNYHVKKPIRDMCVFAVHNILKDPPFAKMDLVTCRNVLIYLEPFLQKKALTIFHYALDEKGVLFLGKSETTGTSSDFFTPLGKKEKFYLRRSVPGKFSNVVGERSESAINEKNYFSKNKDGKTDDFQKSADEVLLAKYTPAGVVVNEQFDIVQFRGATGGYLEPAPGKASLNVLKMAKEGLPFEIRNALHKAKATGKLFTKEGIPVDKGEKLVTLEVIPLLNTVDPHYLILFKEHSSKVQTGATGAVINKGASAKIKKDQQANRIEQLDNELARARDDMHSITEEQEAANEELQSANEELLSGSEELQSLNEELETSKEELQSTNEELITVNQELYDRNEELNQSRKFAETIIATLHEPLIVLDKNFIVKSANKSFYKTFQITEEETLGKALFKLQEDCWDMPTLRDDLKRIQAGNENILEIEAALTFPIIGHRVICINIQAIKRENGEQLILMAIEDITLRKNAEQIEEQARLQLAQNAEMIQNLYLNAPAFVCTLGGPKHIYELVNPAYQKLFGKREILGKPIMEALPELEGQGFDTILDNIYNTGETFVGVEVPVMLARDENLLPEERYFNFSYQPIYNWNKAITGVLVFGYEVTNEILAKIEQQENARRFIVISDAIPAKMNTADISGNVTYLNKQWFEYTHLNFEEMKDWGWKKIIHPDDWGITEKSWLQAIEEGEPYNIEQRLLRYDGVYRWHICRAVTLKDANGNVTGWIGTHSDIEEQKMKEQKKDEFISIASHEMKTPLTTAKAYLQLLEISIEKNDSNSLLYTKRALLSVDRLTDLIKELLDVSKIQSGKLDYNISSFNFNEMIDSAVDDIWHASVKYTIIKTGSVDLQVTGDKLRLQQVVINLLSNAVKYSPGSLDVFINIMQTKNEIKVAVKDNGIGIPKHNLHKIFERYYRVEEQSIQFQGLGIGLYICSEIISRHNGKLWAESEPGKGSTFYFTLPVSKPTKQKRLK